jgi:hypothetical protein
MRVRVAAGYLQNLNVVAAQFRKFYNAIGAGEAQVTRGTQHVNSCVELFLFFLRFDRAHI